MSEQLNHPLPNNTLLKHYHIIKAIATGGYSIVYYAYDQKMETHVAIKEFMPEKLPLRTELNSTAIVVPEAYQAAFQSSLKRFLKEVEIVNQINHPHIIKSVDYFYANGTVYLVMPYEVGTSLSEYINNLYKCHKRMSERDIFPIITSIIQAVNEMHRNGILHLDLKPDNIWLRSNKEVVILDLGTAMLEHEEHSFYPHTAGFAPIEIYAYTKMIHLDAKANELFGSIQSKIITSQNTKVGRWTDYYAIGATLLYMLSFEAPEASYVLYSQGKALNGQRFIGKNHIKLINAINDLCQQDINARRQINLQELANSLKNAIVYPHEEEDYALWVGKKPHYVQDPINLNLL